MSRYIFAVLCVGLLVGAIFGSLTESANQSSNKAKRVEVTTVGEPISNEMDEVGHPTFVSPHASPIAVRDGLVFVVNTPSDTLDVINGETRELVGRVHVGIDPVSVAIRPDGKEVWVSNHVSDSVSVIDSDPSSKTYMQVIATVQEFNDRTNATEFDEPVGIAFANNEKAYVALSSENRIAVVDVESRNVDKKIYITAQEPRDIFVRDNRLYIIPFESNNQTQISGGRGELDGELVTFDAQRHVIDNNNVLSLGAVVDIVRHPDVPDRDLYIVDIETDEVVDTVSSLGTLLYGLTVDSKGHVFVAQADARNDANGKSGTEKHGLKELENRAFLNQITKVSFDNGEAEAPEFFELEPLPPEHPEPGQALATPFAIEISNDDEILFVSAAGSDKLFTVDASNGEVLGRVDVDAVPRGIALECEDKGTASRAWVFNAVANTVSLVDVSDPAKMNVETTIELEDPTHPAVKRGRIAFNTAKASSTETFSCASCHPDGHTDQLVWVLKTPIVTGGDQIMPRSTMPIRGLRDTAPYHWDGIPGDPYGGNNSANVWGEDPPNSDVNDPASSTRHLIDGGLASTMLMEGDETVNDEGKSGRLSASERDDMAQFLLSVPYPPAQKRAFDNLLSDRAKQGFRLFHIEGDHQGDPTPNVCGNCHRMPFLVSTNTPGTGMDAPTWRGANDRWLILPQGRLNLIGFDFYRRVAEYGIPERNVWQFSWAGRRRFDPVWEMVLEGSTGYSGSFARQVTLNRESADKDQTTNLLDALEQSASEGAVVLVCDGLLVEGEETTPLTLRYEVTSENGAYVANIGSRVRFTREELVALALDGKVVATLTAHHGPNADIESPQPGLWTLGPIEQQRGRQQFPILFAGNQTMTISARHVTDGANLIVDGRLVGGSFELDGETMTIELAELPEVGMHFLQVQNQGGPFSNDFIFHVTEDAEGAVALQRSIDREHVDQRSALNEAIRADSLDEVKRLVANGHDIDRRQRDGSIPLSTAALRGNLEIVKFLCEQGADVSRSNRDGNTPLIVAAFMCHWEVVEYLVENDASIDQKNGEGESSIDVVSDDWSDGLAGFYQGVANSIGIEIDLGQIEQDRPKMAEWLESQR